MYCPCCSSQICDAIHVNVQTRRIRHQARRAGLRNRLGRMGWGIPWMRGIRHLEKHQQEQGNRWGVYARRLATPSAPNTTTSDIDWSSSEIFLLGRGADSLRFGSDIVVSAAISGVTVVSLPYVERASLGAVSATAIGADVLGVGVGSLGSGTLAASVTGRGALTRSDMTRAGA